MRTTGETTGSGLAFLDSTSDGTEASPSLSCAAKLSEQTAETAFVNQIVDVQFVGEITRGIRPQCQALKVYQLFGAIRGDNQETNPLDIPLEFAHDSVPPFRFLGSHSVIIAYFGVVA